MQDNKRIRTTGDGEGGEGSQRGFIPLRTLSDDQLERIRINKERAQAILIAKQHIILAAQLPNEIWHYILSLLPVPDFRACRGTCKQFKEVIDSVQFSFWKRLRYTTVRQPMSFVRSQNSSQEDLEQYNMPECFTAHHNLVSLVDIIKLFTTCLYSTCKLSRPVKNAQFHNEILPIFGHIRGLEPALRTADQMMRSEKMQEILPKIGVWAVTSMVLMLSIGWRQILGGTRLWSKRAYFSAGLVFDIGCALNYLESSVFAGKTWSEKSGKDYYAITQEQKLIIECDVGAGQVIMVTAFAGAGKTSSLIEYARRRPGKKFLYLAYSKSLEQEAPKKFAMGGCRNVVARTMHSIAYNYYVSLYGHKIKEDKPTEMAKAVCNALQVGPQAAKYALKTLRNFHISKSDTILRDHIPFQARIFHENLKKSNQETEKFTNLDDFYISLAEKVWKMMTDVDNTDIFMTHDGYLKLYQLNIKDIPRLGYDVIMLDEAQDINPVIAQIMVAEISCSGLIMVGDPHQQIYAFRGAVDAMKRFRNGSIRRLNLSQSFRFGPEIATLANTVLYTLKLERKAIFGMGKPSHIHMPTDHDTPAKRTIICRSNLGVLRVACSMIGKKIFLWGKTKLDLSGVEDLLHMANGRLNKVKNPTYKSLGNFLELEKHANRMKDTRLLGQIAFIQEYEGREDELQAKIEYLKQGAASESECDVVLTNVHQAKGMEWDCVELGPDFGSCFVNTSRGRVIGIHSGVTEGKKNKISEEVNILYVALTRAKHTLVLNETLTDLLEFCSGTRVTVRTKSLVGCEKHSQFPLSRVPSPSPPPSPPSSPPHSPPQSRSASPSPPSTPPTFNFFSSSYFSSTSNPKTNTKSISNSNSNFNNNNNNNNNNSNNTTLNSSINTSASQNSYYDDPMSLDDLDDELTEGYCGVCFKHTNSSLTLLKPQLFNYRLSSFFLHQFPQHYPDQPQCSQCTLLYTTPPPPSGVCQVCMGIHCPELLAIMN